MASKPVVLPEASKKALDKLAKELNCTYEVKLEEENYSHDYLNRTTHGTITIKPDSGGQISASCKGKPFEKCCGLRIMCYFSASDYSHYQPEKSKYSPMILEFFRAVWIADQLVNTSGLTMLTVVETNSSTIRERGVFEAFKDYAVQTIRSKNLIYSDHNIVTMCIIPKQYKDAVLACGPGRVNVQQELNSGKVWA